MGSSDGLPNLEMNNREDWDRVDTSVVNGSLAAAVMREGAEKICVVRQSKRRQDAGDPRRQMHGEERRVESSDMAGLAGEQVVDEEVGGLEDSEGGGPAQGEGLEELRYAARHPRDDAQVRQLAGHAHEDREPGERVPR